MTRHRCRDWGGSGSKGSGVRGAGLACVGRSEQIWEEAKLGQSSHGPLSREELGAGIRTRHASFMVCVRCAPSNTAHGSEVNPVSGGSGAQAGPGEDVQSVADMASQLPHSVISRSFRCSF